MTKQLQERAQAVVSGLKQMKEEEAYGKETGVLASLKHLVTPPKTNIQLNQTTHQLGQKMLDVKTETQKLKEYGDELYAKRVFDSGNSAQKFAKLSSGGVLSQVVTELQKDQGSQPAFYMINANVTPTRGHTVAIHAASHPRLLDANSCEFAFDSMTTLYGFLNDYWQIYDRVGYGAAKVEIFRFDV